MPRTSNRGRNNNPTGRNQYSGDWMSTVKERPMTAAAVAAASVGAGVFLWSKRNQISEGFSSGMDRLSELKSERMGGGRSQEEFSEEALTLKETGRKTRGSRGPVAQQDIKAGIAQSNQEAKAGAKAYS